MMLFYSLVDSWRQLHKKILILGKKKNPKKPKCFYLIDVVAQMNCVVCKCWITASVCGVEMNGVAWLIWFALNQTVPSLREWLLIKGAWTHWMHATVASGRAYIFIDSLPNLIKMGDKLCTEQTISMAQTGFAPLPFHYLSMRIFPKSQSTCKLSHSNYAYTLKRTLLCLTLLVKLFFERRTLEDCKYWHYWVTFRWKKILKMDEKCSV